MREVKLLNAECESTEHYVPGEPMRLEVIVEADGTPSLSLDLFLVDANRTRLGMASTSHFHGRTLPAAEGTYRVVFNFGPQWLAAGHYSFDVGSAVVHVEYDHLVESAIEFDVHFSNARGFPWDFKQSYGYGAITLLSDPEPEFEKIKTEFGSR